MYKTLIALAASATLTSCAYNHKIDVAQAKIEKPALEFSREKLEKPSIITDDKCYLMNSPKTPVVCMLPSEYDKETRNYHIMLDILKQYQISDKYYNSVK
jgi:hypothetical protein